MPRYVILFRRTSADITKEISLHGIEDTHPRDARREVYAISSEPFLSSQLHLPVCILAHAASALSLRTSSLVFNRTWGALQLARTASCPGRAIGFIEVSIRRADNLTLIRDGPLKM